MTDDRTSPVPRLPGADALASLTRVGGTFTVSGDDGIPRDLRTKALQGEVVTASTTDAALTPGRRVSARAYDGDRAVALVFVVEAFEATSTGRSDVRLRLDGIVDHGDERREARVRVESEGAAAVVDAQAGSGSMAMTLVQASHSGLAFIVKGRLEAADVVDLSFDDGTGVVVRCRASIARVERVVYGRHRYAGRIVAMSELDQLRFDRMVTRAQLAGPTAPDAAVRANVDDEGPGGTLRRLFGRA